MAYLPLTVGFGFPTGLAVNHVPLDIITHLKPNVK